MDFKIDSVVLPELLGPIFKVENVTLRQTMYNNNASQRLKITATFVSDEIIYLIEEKSKVFQHELVILLLMDISNLYKIFNQFCNSENSGCFGLSKIFNFYLNTIIEQICLNGGDILKFTNERLLSMWKQNANELVHEILRKVISCCFSIKSGLLNLENDMFDLSEPLVKCAISVGSVTFSIIGEYEIRHYVITGEPVTAVRKAIQLTRSSDLILTESAWEHCILCDYVYVIQDKSHIKIIEELKKHEAVKEAFDKRNFKVICKSKVTEHTRSSTINNWKPNDIMKKSLVKKLMTTRKCITLVQNNELEEYIKKHRYRVLDTSKSNLSQSLKSFVIKPALDQINKDEFLQHLTEIKNITIVMVEITCTKQDIPDIISLIDLCHVVILKACENMGCIDDVNLDDTIITFRIVFGIRSYLKDSNHCRFGIQCASKLLRILKRMIHVDSVSVGVSTGLSCCTVIGNIARRHYAIIGPPIIKVENIILISQNKVTCDIDTVIYSGIKKCYFRPMGLINLKGFEKGYIFSFNDKDTQHDDPATYDLKYAFPILSRFEELELFSKILDDIGLVDRSYAGILIEGTRGIGKSRVLDSYAIMASERQIKVVKLVLHPMYAEQPYAVIYKILVQIIEAEDCKTIDEIERNVVEKFGHLIQPYELCYLNRILRLRFKLSKQYIQDTDWNRHRKSISIIDKILKANNEKICILIDDVHYIDCMSWQYLVRAMNNRDIVLALTMLESLSFGHLSKVETDIYNSKLLLRRLLHGLEPEFLPMLMCQLLDVQGISTELNNFVSNVNINNPSWFELFTTLIMVCGGFDIVNFTPEEASNEELIFPDPILITRIPAELFPESSAPPLPWYKRPKVTVCLTNKKFQIAETVKNFDSEALAMEIYGNLTTYEQDIVKRGSVIGKVFARSMLEIMIPNHQSLKTATAIANLMRLQIFECALKQRRSAKVGDLVVCSFKPTSTFSDMHHLVRCRCSLRYIPSTENHLPRYAHCHFMQFKVFTFQHIVYEQIPENEKKECHSQTVDIFNRDARKCKACGGGSFLKMPSKEILNFNQTKEQPTESKSVVTCPLINLLQDVNDIENRPTEITGISIMPSSLDNDVTRESYGDGKIMVRKQKLRSGFMGRKSKIYPTQCEETNDNLQINNFGHINFHNCSCLTIVDCILSELQQHIDHIDNNDKIINFTIEHAAALVDYGQPIYALKCLAKADARNDYIDTYTDPWENPILHGKILKKSFILCLRGNAYMLLGNYPQAETNYAKALSLFKRDFDSSEFLMCYKTMYEKFRQNIRWTFTKPSIDSRVSYERATIRRQYVAMCLKYSSKILMINNQHKAAKLASLQSIVFGFSSYDPNNFYEQCQLYLSIVKIYGRLGDLQFLSHVEKYMIFAINRKQNINSDDIIILVRVYYSMFKVGLLRGHTERATQFGVKALCYAKAFHMVRLTFKIFPMLTRTFLIINDAYTYIKLNEKLRLKRICEAMDMLQQLRDTALEYVDKSAITWYYALCMDFLLDAGIFVEKVDVCGNHASLILGNSLASVARDCHSLKRLLVNLWLWNLRRGYVTNTAFVKNLSFFTEDLQIDDYSQIITLCKVLECHLILLVRCINMRKGKQMETLLVDIEELLNTLNNIANLSECIKPNYYLLRAYINLIHGRAAAANSYLTKAKRTAEIQDDLMALTWIYYNKTTWKAESFNNMAQYLVESIGYQNSIVWQDIETFDLNDWSNLFYSLPIPEVNI